MIDRLIQLFLRTPLLAVILAGCLCVFGWRAYEENPKDAIPDIAENQTIVFSEWMGRSPKDVDEQVTYPLTVALQGVPDVKEIRATSGFGWSIVYVVFKESAEFYWARSRVLERLNVAQNQLPPGVTPRLGPDATALGQVFWYTLEGRDADGNVVGGWDLHELRTIQDWTVRYALQSVRGVSEVSSIGGYVQEYQVDVDPDAMRAQGVTLAQVAAAVRESNLDVGARTMEINRVEYVVRGIGFLEGLEDLEGVVIAEREHTPIRIRDVAHVHLGPALRRGGLDDAGAEVVGGVVVARYRDNPLRVIEGVRSMIGSTEPTAAAPGSIRGDLGRDWGTTVTQNLIHASDAPESAGRELALWFPPAR